MAVVTEAASEAVKWDSWLITKALTDVWGPFYYRQNFVCIPNLSYAMLSWEADLVAVTNSGYMSEIEIKVTAADWKQDAFKEKWKPGFTGKRRQGWEFIKFFHYAAPLELARRWSEFGIPDFAGVIGVTENKGYEILRPAKQIEGHRKLSEKEMLKIARLTAMRIWNR